MGSYTVKIGGSAVNVEAGSLDVTCEIGQRSQAQLQVWTPTGVSWGYGTQVQIYDETNALKYSGFVDTDKATKPGYAARLEHALTLMDMHYLADKRLAFTSFLNATAGSIVVSLWQNYLAAEGVTLGAVAAGLTIPEVIWNGEQISACLDWLAQQCGFWWEIDQNKVLTFQPYGGVSAPFTLDGTQVSQDSSLSVTFGNRQYRNRQYLVGGKDKTAVLTEYFVGDGKRQAFTLRYGVASISGRDKASESVKGVWLNGAQQTVANKTQQTGAQWYYAIADAVIAQDPSGTPLTASDTLQVVYKGEYPVVALAQNATLIAQQKSLEGGGTGYVEVKESNQKVHTLAAGFQIAQAELAHYGQTMTTLVWSAPVSKIPTGLKQGQLLDVNLPDFALAEQMLVRSIEYTDSIDGMSMWAIVTCIGSPYDVSWQSFFQSVLNQNGADDLSNTDNQGTGTILAELLQVQLTRTPSVRVTLTKYVCPILGPSTKCGPSVKVC